MSELTAADVRRLARSEDPIHRCEAAMHPQITLDDLLPLAAEWPQEITENPALPLLTLSQPQWATALSAAALDALAPTPACPVAVLHEAQRREQPKALLGYAGQRAHPQAQRLAALCALPLYPLVYDWPRWREALADMPDFLDLLHRAGVPWAVLNVPAPAGLAPLDGEAIEALLQRPPLGGHAALLQAALLTEGQRWSLRNHPWPEARMCLAAAPDLSTDLLAHLSEDPEEEIRAQIASRSDLPRWLAIRLSLDTSPAVRRAAPGLSALT